VVRRLAVVLAVAAVLVVLALATYGRADGRDRVVRAVDAMEQLRGVRFSLDASSVASGSGALAGPLAIAYQATGELVPPDTLRLVVSEPAPATLYSSMTSCAARPSRCNRPARPTAPA
jgi:hypothetical protein